jgi:DNA-directed RNA polymerase subunit beta'
MSIAIVDEAGQDRAVHKLTYGAKIHSKDGAQVKRGAKLFEWDPYTLPIIAEKAGVARFVDLVSGISVREDTDEATGMTQKIVSDWRSAPKGNDLKPEVIIMDPATGDPVRGENGNPISYPMSVDAILSVEDGQDIKPGDVVARIPREGAKTKDITGGLPRVAELFEARKPKEVTVISEIDGIVSFGKDVKGKRKVIVTPDAAEAAGKKLSPKEYLIPRGKHISVHEGDRVRAGEPIMDGLSNPHDILSILGEKELAKFLVDEVQEVYRLQGVKINDKHIEAIVRQMLQRVRIQEVGDSDFLLGEQVEKYKFEDENEKIRQRGGQVAVAEPLLLGITKASLSTESFISAASFQETTRVLTQAAIEGKVDYLRGLKENAAMGRLIPAGTGYPRYRRIGIQVESEESSAETGAQPAE